MPLECLQCVWVLLHITSHCITSSLCNEYCDSGGCNDTTVHRKPTVDDGVSLNRAIQSGLLRGSEGPRGNTKSGAHNINCAREIWGHAPGNFEIFTCSEVCSSGF